ncbi:hypothetical protein FRC11_013537, partial [Ceratobasidium sp. 423]
MSGRRNKPVPETGRSRVKAYDVQCAGSRGTVRAIETTASKASAARLIQFAGSSANAEDSNQLQALQFDDAQHMLPDTSPFQAVMDSDFEQLRVELKAETEDVADTYVRTSKAGEGQNEMLRKWSDTWSQLFLAELYRHYASPERAACQ